MVEMKEQLDVTDVKGNKIGVMNVEIAPCNDKGREYTEADDMFVDSPEDLVKKNVNFVFKILNCRGLPNKYTVTKLITYCFYKRSDKLGIHKTHCFFQDVHCKYKIYLEEKDHVTQKISLTANPDFNYKETFKFRPATIQVRKFLCK